MKDTIHRFCHASMFAGLLCMVGPASAEFASEDTDQDGYEDEIDNCLLIYNPDQNNDCGDEPMFEPLLTSSAKALSSPPMLLYDVDFGTPPHIVGQRPVLGRGPANIPTRTWPKIVASS